ncbi:hypothetical protein CATRI_04685 [Corynebacterium atrinae]|uniref:Rv1157c family protein n=1 Tax=Corynebacterium atrinae TaxID=1336740 RepID=UPI0025B2B713|nr:hypothetical protein [Corynebacterium atrinae]WJY63030.1 hypothetical protein CATRI_04685 [Corynebacterium atrinae]
MGSPIRPAKRVGTRSAFVAVAAASAIALTGLLAPSAASASSLPQSPLDELGRPTPQVTQQVRDFANHPWLPKEISDAVLSALAFYAGNGNGSEGGVPLPVDGPGFTQFIWPTVSGKCIEGGLDAVGSAIAVPGPTTIPAPGAADGQTAFLFTALGTSPAAANQGELFVHWFNLTNLRHGITSLDNNGINPEGPATVSGTANTGHGTVVAVVSGNVRTETNSCHFIPTAAIIDAR